MKKKILLIYIATTLLLIISQKQVHASTSCSVLAANCNQNTCMNGICQECTTSKFTVESGCQCETGQYMDSDTGKCAPCDVNCATCSGDATTCTSCTAEDPSGWGLDLQERICDCNSREYVRSTEDVLKKPCQRCYIYGKECLPKCPSGTTKNNDIWRCESEKPEDVANDDKLLIIIVAICIIVLQILLTICLFNYLYNRLKKMFDKDANKIYPLTEEEQLYLAQQAELERQRRMGEDDDGRRKKMEEEEQRRLMKELEEEEKRRLAQLEEEERLRAAEEEARLRAIEEEERRRMEEEEKRRRSLEEEEMQRRMAEDERLRLEEEKRKQWELEQEEKRKALEAQLALEAAQAEQRRKDEEERRKREAEEKERKRLADEEAARLAAEEAERERQRQLAKEAAKAKALARQMTRQATMAKNDDKLRKMREERERLKREKEEMEGFNSKLNGEADGIEGQFGGIEEKKKRAEMRRQETIQIKAGILSRQATIAEKRKELEAALEGVNYQAARDAVQNMNPEDLIFLQNLKNPPERVKLTLDAVIVTLSNSAKKLTWDDVKKEITNINFRKNIFTYDPDKMTDKIMNKLQKEYISNPVWVLPKIHKAAKAAGILAEWLDSLMKFKVMMAKNKPLFDQVKELEKEERAMDSDVARLGELEEQEKAAGQEQIALDGQSEEFKQKQVTLRKQATLNLGDISKRDEQINKLNTGDLSLDKIEEDSDDEDSDDGEANEILKNI